MSGDVQGETFPVSDEVDIAPTSSKTAEISLELNFFNGATCTISGTAKLEGRILVYRASELEGWDGGKGCKLKLWKERKSLYWSDGDNSCESACGFRGRLQGEMPMRYRKPIRSR
ncbi:MAG: hypothetical protein H0W71_09680 [Sphingomonas sp.]|nr:hypothetical protein [Sphingomonas sp.]